MRTFSAAIAAALLYCASTIANADTTSRPDSHAPIGVMGDHTHAKGELMLSYRYMHMFMQGNRDGSSNLTPEHIVSTAPNRFANPPMMPPNLRVVPVEMTMEMHMFGAMYAPSDRVTLMGMVNYASKDMDHLTFQGPVGTNVLGTFSTKTSGIGDTRIAALIRLGNNGNHHLHATTGVSLPTGSTDKTGQILTPMNTTPSPRLPYPMQLGSGTFDFIGGLTYSSNSDRWGWGSQWQSDIRIGDNDEGYTLGNVHRLSGWISYLASDALSISGRIAYFDRQNIDGIDPIIAAPVQTADPDKQGIERIDVGVSVNWLMPDEQHRLALEFLVPVSQRLDGPQLETDWQITLGWQYAP